MIPVVSTADLLALAGDHLWQSTLFAVAALVVAALLKHHSASLRYWVWFAASAKFLVPFATLVAIGGYVLAQGIGRSAARKDPADKPSGARASAPTGAPTTPTPFGSATASTSAE